MPEYVVLVAGPSGLVRRAYGPMSAEEAEAYEDYEEGMTAVPLDRGRPAI